MHMKDMTPEALDRINSAQADELGERVMQGIVAEQVISLEAAEWHIRYKANEAAIQAEQNFWANQHQWCKGNKRNFTVK